MSQDTKHKLERIEQQISHLRQDIEQLRQHHLDALRLLVTTLSSPPFAAREPVAETPKESWWRKLWQPVRSLPSARAVKR